MDSKTLPMISHALRELMSTNANAVGHSPSTSPQPTTAARRASVTSLPQKHEIQVISYRAVDKILKCTDTPESCTIVFTPGTIARYKNESSPPPNKFLHQLQLQCSEREKLITELIVGIKASHMFLTFEVHTKEMVEEYSLPKEPTLVSLPSSSSSSAKNRRGTTTSLPFAALQPTRSFLGYLFTRPTDYEEVPRPGLLKKQFDKPVRGGVDDWRLAQRPYAPPKRCLNDPSLWSCWMMRFRTLKSTSRALEYRDVALRVLESLQPEAKTFDRDEVVVQHTLDALLLDSAAWKYLDQTIKLRPSIHDTIMRKFCRTLVEFLLEAENAHSVWTPAQKIQNVSLMNAWDAQAQQQQQSQLGATVQGKLFNYVTNRHLSYQTTSTGGGGEEEKHAGVLDFDLLTKVWKANNTKPGLRQTVGAVLDRCIHLQNSQTESLATLVSQTINAPEITFNASALGKLLKTGYVQAALSEHDATLFSKFLVRLLLCDNSRQAVASDETLEPIAHAVLKCLVTFSLDEDHEANLNLLVPALIRVFMSHTLMTTSCARGV
ncbi:hypothetical protein BASA81_009148 [Batrachochytrium salamandrivorans]|nr:hypothetical protein BASA81_009148 [Batrachochytrium salamandrivorans]